MAENPGAVRDAIVSYLRKQGVDGASLLEIREAVNKALGHEVAQSSVRSYLRLNTPKRFERTGRGTYRLVNA